MYLFSKTNALHFYIILRLGLIIFNLYFNCSFFSIKIVMRRVKRSQASCLPWYKSAVREKDNNLLGDNKSTFSKICVNDKMLLNSNRTMHFI